MTSKNVLSKSIIPDVKNINNLIYAILVCFAAIIFSGFFIILEGQKFQQPIEFSIFQNIALGIFSSAIVSCVISTAAYFHERNIILEKIEPNIRSLYINMYVLSRMEGNTLSQVYSTTDLSSLPFRNISGLSKLNLDFLGNMELGLYSPFRKSEKFVCVINRLKEFQSIVYNIHNIAINLEIQTLEYSNQFLEIRKAEISGIQPNPNNYQNLDALKNLINIKTAKFHEYTTGQFLEIEKILKLFYKYKNKKLSWDNIKNSMLSQAEDILKR